MGKPTPAYTTPHGQAYQGDALEILPSLRACSINLCFTSPPFPLHRAKEYGNVTAAEYVNWLLPIAREIYRVLAPDGSFVFELGGGWDAGAPTQSPMEPALELRLCELGFYRHQPSYWMNTRALPAPAEWVCRQRVCFKDAVTRFYRFAKTPHPHADNREVITPYAREPGRLPRPGLHPSGHRIVPESWAHDNGGAIPPNYFAIPGVACDDYVRRCRAAGCVVHPARQPPEIPERFIRFLTRAGDTVLDPFGGSNTTAAVAQRLGRRWVSIELRADYVEASKLRFEDDLPGTEAATA